MLCRILFKFFDKMVNKGGFLKIIHLFIRKLPKAGWPVYKSEMTPGKIWTEFWLIPTCPIRRSHLLKCSEFAGIICFFVLELQPMANKVWVVKFSRRDSGYKITHIFCQKNQHTQRHQNSGKLSKSVNIWIWNLIFIVKTIWNFWIFFINDISI